MAAEIGVPAGSWERDPSHSPVALTPLYVDYRITGGSAGMSAAGEEFSSILPARSAIVVDGWQYVGTLAGVDQSPERVAAFEEKVRVGHEAVVLSRWRTELRPALLARLQGLQRVELAMLTDTDLLAYISEISACEGECMSAHFVDGMAAAVYHGRLGLFCQKALGLTPAEVLQLLAGCSSATREPAARLEAIAARVYGDPDLRAAIDEPDAASSARVRELLAPWLTEYGYRATAFEFVVPTAIEEPDRVLQRLRDAVAQCAAGAEPTDARVSRLRDEAVTAVRGRLGDDAQRTVFDALLAGSQDAYQVRDDDVSFSMWTVGLQRHALLEAGRRFAAQGSLDAPDDIWFLRRDEVEGALSGEPPEQLRERVAERRAAFQRQQQTTPPVRLGSAPAPVKLPPLSEAAMAWLRAAGWGRDFLRTPARAADAIVAPGSVRGMGASRGVYRGPARVVLSEEEFDRVQPGDVLVCPMTTPGWNILFGSVGALVTNEGGILSHPAIIAREFGIPAVVGTHTATTSIKDGAIVEVDGAAGTVSW